MFSSTQQASTTKASSAKNASAAVSTSSIKSDLAIIVIPSDAVIDLTYEKEIVDAVKKRDIPFIVAVNKTDLKPIDNASVSTLKNDFLASGRARQRAKKTGIEN